MKKYTLEICVDSVESAINATKGGTTRLELCSNLVIGGTTPTYSLFNLVKKNVNIDINVLIRPRFGDFNYSNYEFEIIKEDVNKFKDMGASGVVIGFLDIYGNVDKDKVREIVNIAGKMNVTFHRAFDVCCDPISALSELENLGVKTILTSGQKNTAIEGIDLINKLLSKKNNMEILVGSGVNISVIKSFLKETSATAFHMSAKKEISSEMLHKNKNVSMGLPILSEYVIWQTDKRLVEEVAKYLEVIN